MDEAVAAYLKASELAPSDLFMQLRTNNALNKLERYEDAKVVEDRIAEIQKMQEEQRKMQEEFEKMMEEAQKEKDAQDAETGEAGETTEAAEAAEGVSK